MRPSLKGGPQGSPTRLLHPLQVNLVEATAKRFTEGWIDREMILLLPENADHCREHRKVPWRLLTFHRNTRLSGLPSYVRLLRHPEGPSVTTETRAPIERLAKHPKIWMLRPKRDIKLVPGNPV